MDRFATVTPPFKFGTVELNIYRSNTFEAENFGFIKSLRLKSIITLSPEFLPRSLYNFIKEHNITLKHQGLDAWRPSASWKPVSEELVKEALEFCLTTKNQPVLIMCTSGVLQTGVVVGCLRRLVHWSLSAILDEYRRYSGSKARFSNEQFIELFDTDIVSIPRDVPGWFSEQLKLLHDEKEEFLALTQGTKAASGLLQLALIDASKVPLISDQVQFDRKKSIIDIDDPN